MTSPLRDDERDSGRRGVAGVRRLLREPIIRDGAIYRVQCCTATFVGMTSAEVHVLTNECSEGETE